MAFFALRQAMRGVYRVRSFGDRVSAVVACRDIESEVAVMQVPHEVSVGKLAEDRGKAPITSDTLGVARWFVWAVRVGFWFGGYGLDRIGSS